GEPLMACALSLRGLRERRSRIEARRLQQHQRLELLQERLILRLVVVDQTLERGVGLLEFGRRGPWDGDRWRYWRRRPDDHWRKSGASPARNAPGIDSARCGAASRGHLSA